MADPNIKGISLLHLGDFIRHHFGDTGLQRISAALPPEVSRLLTESQEKTWYPLRAYVDAEVKLVELFYSGDVTQGFLVGRYDLDTSINQAYRFVFKFLAPTFLIQRASQLYSTFVDQGRLRLEEARPGHAVCDVTGLPKLHRAYCHDIRGSIHASLEVNGAQDVRVEHTECIHDGAARCRYVATFR